MTIYRNPKFKDFKFVPVKFQSKKPLLQDWLNNPKPIESIQENTNHNIGVLLGSKGNDIVDIDLDHLLAIKLGSRFLPPTDMIFGRKGKPNSHWIYRVSPPGKTRQFKFGTMGMILEYRSEGMYTVFPESTHESGEKIEFSKTGEPAIVDADKLKDMVCRLAAACIIAEHWQYGLRHHISLALCGGLMRADWTDAQIEHLIESVCWATGDNEQKDRVANIKTTRQRKEEGLPFTGWPELQNLIDEKAANKIMELLGVTISVAYPPSMSPTHINPPQNNAIPESYTDAGNGKLFLKKHSDKCFYNVDSKSWHVWNGKCWKADKQNRIRIFAHETANGITAAAGNNSELNKWGKTSGSTSRLNGMLEEAKPYMSKSSEQLDLNPYLVNCENGTFDLKNGKLKPHDPNDFITHMVHVQYDPKADCPQFERFLSEIFQNNQEMIEYIQKAFGYCLTGDTSEQKFFLLYGQGSNGKGTLIETIKGVLGSYALTMQAESLMQQSHTSGASASPDIARLRGARSVFISEGDRSNKLNEALVKQLTGQDKLTARQLYGAPFEFVPQCKFMLQTNYLPKIRGIDLGIWRRIVPIPFNAQFTGQNVDKHLRSKLEKESSGILNWMIEGCLLWQKEGLDEPQAVLDAKKAYRSESDNVRLFADQVLTITPSDPNATIGKKNLYLAYQNWVKREGETYTASQREFSQIVCQIDGVGEGRTSTQRCWKGIKLLDINLETPYRQFA